MRRLYLSSSAALGTLICSTRSVRQDVESTFSKNHWSTFKGEYGGQTGWAWEETLIHASWSDIAKYIQDTLHCTRKEEIAYTNAVYEHLTELREEKAELREEEAKKKAELREEEAKKKAELRIFQDSSSTWPELFDPEEMFDDQKKGFHFVTTTKGEWVMSDPDPSGQLHHGSRMVRPKVYGEVWKILEGLRKVPLMKRRGFTIKGNPGIGKSYLLDILLSASLFKYPDEPVLVISSKSIELFCKIGGVEKRFIVEKNEWPRLPKRLPHLGIKLESEMLVLHDIKTSEALPYQTTLMDWLVGLFRPICCLVSSPKASNFHQFEKDFVGRGSHESIILPILTRGEAELFVKKANPQTTTAQFEEWYDVVGGVPRNLVDDTRVKEVIKEQIAAVPEVKYDPVSSLITGDASHKILQLIPPSSPDGPVTHGFVSAHACRIWWEKLKSEAEQQKLLRKLREAQNESTRGVLGSVFEQWVISVIKNISYSSASLYPKSLTILSLDAPLPGQSRLLLEPWEIPKNLSLTSFPTNDFSRIQAMTWPMLYLPQSSNFPVVDTVIVQAKSSVHSRATVDCDLIQVTVAPSHQPTLASTTSLLSALKAANLIPKRVVWVVDSQSKLHSRQDIKDGKLAEWDAIPQYRCQLDDFRELRWVKRKDGVVLSFPCVDATKKTSLGDIQKLVDPQAKKLAKNSRSGHKPSSPLKYM